MNSGEFLRREAARKRAAMVDGVHYTAHVDTVKAMRRAGNDDEAAALLLRLIEAIEREADHPLPGHGAIPPWYFGQLEAIYKKAGLLKDRGLLQQRYALLAARSEKDALLAKNTFFANVSASPAKAARSPAKPPSRAATGFGRALGNLAHKLLNAADRPKR